MSKKLGSAVVRNRAKRIVRAAYDTVKDELKTGNLIVISVRMAATNKKSTDVAAELRNAFESLKLLAESKNNKTDNHGTTT